MATLDKAEGLNKVQNLKLNLRIVYYKMKVS